MLFGGFCGIKWSSISFKQYFPALIYGTTHSVIVTGLLVDAQIQNIGIRSKRSMQFGHPLKNILNVKHDSN